MDNPKPFKIFCPRCKHYVATWDGRTTTPTVARCERCKKRVVFDPVSKKIEVKNIPPRNCASGVTFI